MNRILVICILMTSIRVEAMSKKEREEVNAIMWCVKLNQKFSLSVSNNLEAKNKVRIKASFVLHKQIWQETLMELAQDDKLSPEHKKMLLLEGRMMRDTITLGLLYYNKLRGKDYENSSVDDKLKRAVMLAELVENTWGKASSKKKRPSDSLAEQWKKYQESKQESKQVDKKIYVKSSEIKIEKFNITPFGYGYKVSAIATNQTRYKFERVKVKLFVPLSNGKEFVDEWCINGGVMYANGTCLVERGISKMEGMQIDEAMLIIIDGYRTE